MFIKQFKGIVAAKGTGIAYPFDLGLPYLIRELVVEQFGYQVAIQRCSLGFAALPDGMANGYLLLLQEGEHAFEGNRPGQCTGEGIGEQVAGTVAVSIKERDLKFFCIVRVNGAQDEYFTVCGYGILMEVLVWGDDER